MMDRQNLFLKKWRVKINEQDVLSWYISKEIETLYYFVLLGYTLPDFQGLKLLASERE